MTVLRLASLATVRAGIVSNQAAVRDLVLRGLNDPTWSPSADDALGIAHAFLARGDLETATSVVERFQNNRDRVRPRKYEAIAGWLRMACAEPPSGETQTADASFVLWDHQGLDPAMSPRNIAPFMDSLSALVALARLKASLRSDDAEVQSLCDQIAERIDGSSKRPFRGTVRLHAVPRQSSHLANIPVGTWALVSGPLVRRSKTAEARFPFDGRVLPIFTGVHVDADVLGRPGATDCLRASGPVGCADWNSVFLLRAAHVPAFFSGPAAPALSVAAVARGGSQLLESAPTARVRVSWSDSEVPTRSVGGNLSAALAGIDDLAAISQDARVVTGDTAAFWLARSMGLHVRLRVGRKRPVHDSEVDMSASRLRDLAATRAADLVPARSLRRGPKAFGRP